MKKIYTLLFCLLAVWNVRAQIGATAPDFTVVSIDGDTIRLYADVLDKGLIAVVDVSATWCPPCWTLHQSHALEDLYLHHGPDGSNQLRVVFYEGDPNTDLAALQGTGNQTLGDWVTGTPYPIINESPLSLDLNIWAPEGFPTVSVIEPASKKIVADTWNLTSYESQVNAIEAATQIDLVDAVATYMPGPLPDARFYPNPATDVLHLILPAGPMHTVTVFDLLGNVLMKKENLSGRCDLDVSDLPRGRYLMRIATAYGERTEQLIIARP